MRAGWAEATVGEICEFRYGRALKAQDRSGAGWPVYGSNGIVGAHDAALTQGPTIVIGRKGSYGEVHYSPTPAWPIDTTYFVDETCTSCDIKWLAYRLNALGLTRLNRAAAVPGLNREDAYRLRLLLPPVTEQRRIVSILDATDSLREKRLRTLSAIPELANAVFAHMFTDTERRRWDYLSIGELCDMSSGGTPNRDVSDNFKGDIPWIKSGELHDPVVASSEETITDCGLRSSSAKILPPGTVLVAMYGATAGVVSELAIPATTNQAICSLEPREKLRTPFLVFALRESMPKLLALRAGGAQPNLSQARIREHQLPVPPLHLQDEFSALHCRAMSQKELALKHLAQFDALFASLQHRAFNAEL